MVIIFKSDIRCLSENIQPFSHISRSRHCSWDLLKQQVWLTRLLQGCKRRGKFESHWMPTVFCFIPSCFCYLILLLKKMTRVLLWSEKIEVGKKNESIIISNINRIWHERLFEYFALLSPQIDNEPFHFELEDRIGSKRMF